MNPYKNKFRIFLDNNPISYTEGDSLMEELYWCYTEANTVDSPQLRMHFQNLYQSLPELSEKRFDEVFSAVSTLAAEQEKLAFQSGARIGFRPASELLE